MFLRRPLQTQYLQGMALQQSSQGSGMGVSQACLPRGSLTESAE